MPEETRLEIIKRAIDGLKREGVPEQITRRLEKWLERERLKNPQ